MGEWNRRRGGGEKGIWEQTAGTHHRGHDGQYDGEQHHHGGDGARLGEHVTQLLHRSH